MDFKIGDKVRFINKTKGNNIQTISQEIGFNLLTDCYGVVHSLTTGGETCRCYIHKNSNGNIPNMGRYRDHLIFSIRDLVKYINYDDLSEIEE